MTSEVKNIPYQDNPNDGSTSRPMSDKLQETRIQVDEVFGIMQENLNKVLERDEKLHELDDKADVLLMGASQFQSKAGTLKRKMWWKNLKMKLILASIAVFILLLIIYKIGF